MSQDYAADHANIADLDENGPVDKLFQPLSRGFFDRAIFEHFRDTAMRHGEALAVQDAETRLSYRQLLEASARFSATIDATVAPGEAVAILLPNSAAFAVAVLACLAAGRPYIALDRRYPAQRNREILDDAQPSALVCRAEDRSLLANEATIRWIDIETLFRPEPLTPPPPHAVDLDAPASILFTSGSTGRPKGVATSQRALLQRIAQHIAAFHLADDDRLLLLHSFCTVAGTREALSALLSGAALHIVDPETAGLMQIRRLVRDREITFFCTVPALLRLLLEDADGADFASVRAVRVNGDRVLWSDIALLRRTMPAGCHIQVGYSATETIGAQWFVPPGHSDPGPCVPVGYPLPGIAIRILGEDGRDAPPGGEGELVITSPYVALGHWREGRCVPFDVTAAGARTFATGDIVRRLPDGRLDVLGRKDRQVKVNGRRVEPAELEAALLALPGVNDAAVVPRRSAEKTVLIAFAAPSPGERLEERAIRAALREKLPSELVPARLHVLEQLPRLPGAKIDGVRLAQLDEELCRVPPSASSETPPGKTAIAEGVRRAWIEALGRRAYAADRSFLEAGGSFLKFTRFVSELERTFRCAVSPKHVRGSMTPGEIEAVIATLDVDLPALKDRTEATVSRWSWRITALWRSRLRLRRSERSDRSGSVDERETDDLRRQAIGRL